MAEEEKKAIGELVNKAQKGDLDSIKAIKAILKKINHPEKEINMTETQYKQVTEALVNFITRVGNGKADFTAEVKCLPEVVRALMDFDARTPKAKAVPNIAFIAPSDINNSHSFSGLKVENKKQNSMLKEIASTIFKTLDKYGWISDDKFETIINELENLKKKSNESS